MPGRKSPAAGRVPEGMSAGVPARLWSRLPVVVRAITGGLFVQVVGFVILATLLPLNLRFAPTVPWAIVPLGLGLYAYWRYFGGAGPPASTRARRRELRRSNPIDPRLRWPVVLAATLFTLTLLSTSFAQLALRPVPAEALGLVAGLASTPWWTAIPLALTAAIFVGMGEEMSYRGYVELPIEQRHGALVGVLVAALVFALSHGADLAFLPMFFVVSIGWGVLARFAGSIRPGIVVHAVVDGSVFVFGIFRLGDLQALARHSMIVDGLSPADRALLATAAGMVLATVAAFAWLHARARARTRTLGGPAPQGAPAG